MVQEGDLPAENMAELIAELEAVARELSSLHQAHQPHELRHRFCRRAHALRRTGRARRALAMRRKLYADLAGDATVQQNRYMRTEVKYVSTINVSENQKRAAALAREYRELDARIQALNWDTELL